MHTARVVSTHLTDFGSLPDYWLMFEHEVGARTRKGLEETLDRIYGALSGWRDGITVVFFWI